MTIETNEIVKDAVLPVLANHKKMLQLFAIHGHFCLTPDCVEVIRAAVGYALADVNLLEAGNHPRLKPNLCNSTK